MTELIKVVLELIGSLAVLVTLLLGAIKLWGLLYKRPTVDIMTKPKVEITGLDSKHLYKIIIDIIRIDARKQGSFGISNIALESNVGRYDWKQTSQWGYDPIHEESFIETFVSSKKVTELKGKLIFTTIFGNKIKTSFKATVTIGGHNPSSTDL